MNNLHVSLKKRAEIVSSYLNSFEGITCNQVEGALYAFPKINLP
jgi:alanine transaminase